MLDTLSKSTVDERMLGALTAMRPSPRVERMREAFFSIPTTASIERARLEARIMEDTIGEPMITRRAKTFAAAVREMPIDIRTDELLVGCISVRPRCRNVTPMVTRLASGLPADIAARIEGTENVPGITPGEMGDLSDEDRKELTENLIPRWEALGRPKHLWHYGHNIHNYEKVLRLGFLGIKQEAEARLARIDRNDPEEAPKLPMKS